MDDTNGKLEMLLASILEELKSSKSSSDQELQFYSLEKAASVLDLSEDMLQYYTRPNNIEIPFVWVGKSKRFSNHDLRAWYEKSRVKTARETREIFISKRGNKK